jgi:ATP-dependent RNA helicase DeaD
MLRAIERATRQPIEEMKLPTVEAVNDVRINRFKQRISDTLAVGELGLFQQLIEQYEQEHNVPAIEIAAALARIAQGDQPLLLTAPPKREFTPRERDDRAPAGRDRDDRRTPFNRDGDERRPPRERLPQDAGGREFTRPMRAHTTEEGKRTYRVEVGHEHGVKPGNIIGAIANEAGLESQFIGRLSIRGEYSLVDLPDGMPAEVFDHLRKVWVSQQQLRISEWDGKDDTVSAGGPPPRRQGGGGFKPRPSNGGGKPPRRK